MSNKLRMSSKTALGLLKSRKVVLDKVTNVKVNRSSIKALKEVLSFLGWKLAFKKDMSFDSKLRSWGLDAGLLYDSKTNEPISHQFFSPFDPREDDDSKFCQTIRCIPIIAKILLCKEATPKHNKRFVACYLLEILKLGIVWRIGGKKTFKMPKFDSFPELKMKMAILNGDQKLSCA